MTSHPTDCLLPVLNGSPNNVTGTRFMNKQKIGSKGVVTNRRGKNSKKKPCRSSIKYCQERLACHGQPLAKYRCEECETLQCESCENLLHENAKFIFHDRVVIDPTPLSYLCQENCPKKNFADVFCEKCSKRYCFECENLTHGTKYKSHHRVAFETPTPDSAEIDTDFDQFYSVDCYYNEENDENCNEIEISPTSSSILSTEIATTNTPTEVAELSATHFPDSDTEPTTIPMESQKMKTKKSEKKASEKVSERETFHKSFILVDDKENLLVKNEEEFLDRLKCPSTTPVKIVSIFGNTGEGKSHTLNHTFFDGQEIFRTSEAQASCTIGIWAAYNKRLNVVTIDTEGLLGFSMNVNQRTRLLLKVMAVSDIVIYRTRAERLHNDLFQFLGDASQAYIRYFTKELRAVSRRCNIEGSLSVLGPSVIIFHETQHTDIIANGPSYTTPEEILKYRFKELGYIIDAFSALEYIGTQTTTPPTNFSGLFNAVKRHLDNSTVRSARKASVLYQALKVFNDKFCGDIDKTVPSMFPDQYFTCSSKCLSCHSRCQNGMNHMQDGILHDCNAKCGYQHQYDNRIFTCKNCYERGKEIIVVPKTSSSMDSSWFGLAKYAWSGYVLECSYCGVIFRSREYWYGNRDPVETVIRTEIRHVWPGVIGNTVLQGTHNAAQKVIDGVKDISCAVVNASAKPTKMLTSWMADQIAPSYWVPNSEIMNCSHCHKVFEDIESKHHCRACGGGFCEDCSNKSRPVPERGWGNDPVRVCDNCYNISENVNDSVETEVMARKVGEVNSENIRI
ncbi:Zinc finger FYVE domain-containing protein 1 [Nymphon striatum]|nr:Zinc finger FYVE domain-containing protein 1 [Nymphon striatum]